MNIANYQPEKLFTVEEANATLPLVRAIVGDLTTLARDVHERRQRLEHLLDGRDAKAADPYSDELRQMQEELEADIERLRGYLEEIRDLGAEPKGLEDGLVDFPSLMEGRIVYLCWKFDEPEILHWHELEAGFTGRQLLPVEMSVDAGE